MVLHLFHSETFFGVNCDVFVNLGNVYENEPWTALFIHSSDFLLKLTDRGGG